MPKNKVHKFKDEQGRKGRFDEGWLPISDTKWKVETIVNGEFVDVGEVSVSGKLVREEMTSHMSIKDYESHDIAEKLAHEKFPKANPIIVTQYGRTKE